jgi:hypothetical protein
VRNSGKVFPGFEKKSFQRRKFFSISNLNIRGVTELKKFSNGFQKQKIWIIKIFMGLKFCMEVDISTADEN